MDNVKLSEICDIVYGKGLQTKSLLDNGYPVFGANSVIGFYSEYLYDEQKVLISCRGANSGTINLSPCKCYVTNNSLVLNIKNNVELEYKYLFYMLKAANKSDIVTGTAQPQVTINNAKTLEIPLPSLPEQNRIVEKLDELFSELDNGIATLQKTKAQLKVYRQAVLKDAFEGICEYDNITLGECIVNKPKNGYSPKAVNYETPYKNLTLTATTSGFFKDGFYKYVDISIDGDSHLWLKRNDILIQRANTIEYVGTAAIYLGDDNKYVYPDLMMKIRVFDLANPKFILYQLQLQSTKNYYKEKATGTAGNMPKINQATVMNTPILLCDIEMQNIIVSKIESRLSICDQIEKTVDESLRKAKSLRQSILKQAFEGRL